MAEQLNKYDPTVLIEIVVGSETLRYATKDIHVGGYAYRGDLTTAPNIITSLSDRYYGTQEGTRLTLQFNNMDNGVDRTWDAIISDYASMSNPKDLREGIVILKTYEPTDGVSYIARGIVNGYKLGDTVDVDVKLRTEPVFDTLLPKHVVTADLFDSTALDKGKPVNICFGYCKNVPLRHIKSDYANSLFYYLIGYGNIQGLYEIANLHGVKRWWNKGVDGAPEGVVCDTGEYTFYDGSQATPFPGYALVVFGQEQVDANGNPYPVTADIVGLQFPGEGHVAGIEYASCYNSWSDGTYIYAAFSGPVSPLVGGIYAYTVNELIPTYIANISDINTAGARDICGDASYLYLANYSTNTDAVYAYSFNGSTFTLLDSETTNTSAIGVHTDNAGKVFVACSYDGIKAYSFSGTAFTYLGGKDDGGRAMGVWYDQTYDWIFLANESDGVRAYTFSGSTFTGIGHHDEYAAYDVWVKDSAISGEVYVFVAYYTKGLKVFSFDGSTFTELDHSGNLGGVAWSVYGDSNDNIFVAAEYGGVIAFSFDGTDLTLQDKIINADRTYGIYTDGTNVYASSYDDGLYIYDYYEDMLYKNRNYATSIQNLLEDSTWGLSETTDAASFSAAVDELSLSSYLCDGAITKQRKASDILRDLMLPCRASLLRNADDGEWEIEIDITGRSSVANFGYNDGQWDNIIEVISCTVSDTDSALKKSIAQYDIDPSNYAPAKELEVDVFDFGVEKTTSLPFVSTDVTAKKVLSYYKNKSIYGDQRLELQLGLEGRDRAVNEVIKVTIPDRNITAQTFQIESIEQNGIDQFTITCSKYDTSIYDDVTITSPTAWDTSLQTNFGPETVYPQPTDENLVMYFPFDEGSGLKAANIVDPSNSTALTGTWSDSEWVGGVSGKALKFLGTNQLLYVDNPLINKTECTITAFVYKTANVSDQTIFCDWYFPRENIVFGIEDATDRWQCRIGDGTDTEALYIDDSLELNTWYFVAMKFIGASGPTAYDGEFHIYIGKSGQGINKVSNFNVGLQNIGATQSTYCAIGWTYNWSSYSKIIVDEFRMYDSALDDYQIRGLNYAPVNTTGITPIRQIAISDDLNNAGSGGNGNLNADLTSAPVSSLTVSKWEKIIDEATGTAYMIPLFPV